MKFYLKMITPSVILTSSQSMLLFHPLTFSPKLTLKPAKLVLLK